MESCVVEMRGGQIGTVSAASRFESESIRPASGRDVSLRRPAESRAHRFPGPTGTRRRKWFSPKSSMERGDKADYVSFKVSCRGDLMFGYININKKDLSKEEFADYRAYYCGLCRTLKTRGGYKDAALLTYDMTFLVILLTGLYEPDTREERLRCTGNPFLKETVKMNRFTDYAADMTVLLTWQKFADDYRDEKKRSRRAMMKLYHEEYKRTALKYPRQTKTIETSIRRLHRIERRGETNLDVAAGTSGEMLGEIFVYDEKDFWARDLREMGFYLGKFIYLMDAYEDLDEDRKNGNYNVLNQLRHENRTEFDDISRAVLVSMMSEAARAFERLPIILNVPLLRNVMYSGVWTKFELIREKNRRRANKKSRTEAEKSRKKERRTKD